jgi:hypothetical protein
LRRSRTGLVRAGSAALLAAVAVSGCGGRPATAPVSTAPSEHWSRAACIQESSSIADEASRFVRAFKPGFGIGSIADVAYFGLRTMVGGFEQHHCPTSVLGRTLARQLTRRQQRVLFSHLPAAMAAYFRMAITTSQR